MDRRAEIVEAIRKHVLAVAAAAEADFAQLEFRYRKAEAEGWRLIEWSYPSPDNPHWRVTDYRTDEVLLEGSDLESFETANNDDQLGPNWWNIENAWGEFELVDVPTTVPGLPDGLVRCLTAWADDNEDAQRWANQLRDEPMQSKDVAEITQGIEDLGNKLHAREGEPGIADALSIHARLEAAWRDVLATLSDG